VSAVGLFCGANDIVPAVCREAAFGAAGVLRPHIAGA
jgi:hypothetical protein